MMNNLLLINSKKKTVVFSFLFALIAINFAWAQQMAVTGKVTSQDDSEPLVGVTVVVKGTAQGAVTNLDGVYSLNIPSEDAILIFSYVGMEKQEIAVDGRSNIDVAMVSTDLLIGEVVITGYGSQKKENISGAVDQIKLDQVESRPINNLAQGLQGLSPNLNIAFTSGDPGQAAKINIRGLTSINGGEPLILVDGVPSDAIELNRIAPEDVESISVLKDASSAAIYGARAAFGVILITTKSGANEGINISYNSNYMWGTPTVLPNKITDPYIYLRLRETSTDNTPWDNQNYSDEMYLWAKQRSEDPSVSAVRPNPNDPGSWEYMGDRDWTQYFLDNYTFSQNQNVSIGGRSQSTQYFISGGYNRYNGSLNISDDYFDRYTFRSKVNYDVNSRIKIGNNTFLTSTKRQTPTYFDMWELYNFHPTDWHQNPDGTWANTPVGRMGAKLEDGGETEQRYNSLQTTFTGEIQLIPEILRVNADYTFRRGNTHTNLFTTRYNIGFGPEDIREEGNNFARRDATFDRYNVFNVYGTFNKLFSEKHQLTVIAGYNQEEFRTEFFIAQRNGVISSSLPTIALATGDAQVGEDIREWAVRGVFYRLNYIFDNKYIIEFNGRYDGSSKFPSGNRFGFFPSASAAWRIDMEPFMQNTRDVVSMLKLRGSYGSLGNQFVSEYGYIPTMQARQGNYVIDGTIPQRVTPPGLVSSNYTWEEVTSIDIGLDVALFDNRVTANFDYFQRDTEGMLTLGRDLPDVLGASEPRENAADLRTTGWEFSIEYRNSFQLGRKPLSFSTRFILADSRSEITSFDNPNQNLTQFYEGQELGEIWGLTSDGLFRSEEEIQQLDQTSIIPWGALSIVPGWPKYQDLDGNGAIERGLTVDDPKDLSIIGNITPRYRFGLNVNAEWNGFDVSTFVQGIGQRDYYPLDYLYWGFYQQPYAGGYAHLTDFYRGADDGEVQMSKHAQSYIDAGLAYANPDATYPVLQAWLADRNLGERVDQAMGLAIPQTRYLLDASYVRIKNLTIGYTLPLALTQRFNIDRIRIYASGENLAEWSEVADYFDPESINDVDYRYNPGSNPNSRTNGKGYAYPFQRRYSVGLNLNF